MCQPPRVVVQCWGEGEEGANNAPAPLRCRMVLEEGDPVEISEV